MSFLSVERVCPGLALMQRSQCCLLPREVLQPRAAVGFELRPQPHSLPTAMFLDDE